RLPHDSRRARHHAHQRVVPDPVRDGADQGIRGDAHHRPDRQHVHGGAVHAHDLRLLAEPRESPAAEHLVFSRGESMAILQLLIGTNIPFMKFRTVTYMFSGALILATAVWLIVHGGPKYSVDFTGGTLIQLRLSRTL